MDWQYVLLKCLALPLGIWLVWLGYLIIRRVGVVVYTFYFGPYSEAGAVIAKELKETPISDWKFSEAGMYYNGRISFIYDVSKTTIYRINAVEVNRLLFMRDFEWLGNEVSRVVRKVKKHIEGLKVNHEKEMATRAVYFYKKQKGEL